MTRLALLAHLRRLTACREAQTWAAETTGEAAHVWAACPRGDWLLWLAARVGVDRRVVVRAACAVARQALRHVPQGEERPRLAVEAAEAWARGEVGIGDVRVAYAAAAAVVALGASACAAADSACAAAAAAYADAAAAAAAAAAGYAAVYAADADTARAQSLAASAALVRGVIPWSTVESALEVAC